MIDPSMLATPRRSSASSDEIVQVLTRSEELFAKIVEIGQVSPYRHFRRTGAEEEIEPGGVMLVDTGTMEVSSRKFNSGEGILVLGKGETLLQQWKNFLDLRTAGECSPEGLEEFLRLRVRQALQRSCTWPGGAYDFFQGILSSVLISEALDADLRIIMINDIHSVHSLPNHYRQVFKILDSGFLHESGDSAIHDPCVNPIGRKQTVFKYTSAELYPKRTGDAFFIFLGQSLNHRTA